MSTKISLVIELCPKKKSNNNSHHLLSCASKNGEENASICIQLNISCCEGFRYVYG